MCCELTVGDWLRISVHQGVSFCVQLYLLMHLQLVKNAGLLSKEACPGLTLCSPPSLRCAMRQCGSTVKAALLFAGMKGKDIMA